MCRSRNVRDWKTRWLAPALIACGLAGCSFSASRIAPALRPATAADILRIARQPGHGAALVNVWATWCMPCREEFPDLLRLHREFSERGLRLILVSADFSDDREEQVGRFLAERGVRFPSYLKEGDDMEFIDALDPRWSGALPATFLYDGEGTLRGFWEGRAPYAALEAEIRSVLGDASRGAKEES